VYNTSTTQLSSGSGCTYDAAGDLTTDCSNMPAHTYQWDAEGRVASVDSGSTWGFTYNALGQRVQWTYSNGAGANQLLFDPAGGWLGVAGIYSLLRRGDGYLVVYFSSETYLNHMNNIGSTTAVTNHAGTPVGEVLFYPWGQVWQGWGSGGSNFAELPYDDGNTNTNLTMFRLQSPGLGRWLSPDPLGGDPTNPQSLDRYAYVLNSPTSMVDPLGLFAPNPCGFDPSLCAAPGGGGGGGGRPRPCAQIVMAGGSVQPDALGCGALLLVAVPAAGHRRPVLKEMLGDPGSAPGISSTPHPNLAPRSRRL
jgi:RHS repeat-associated protein